jgi:apolipoprotein N-acyltransferase
VANRLAEKVANLPAADRELNRSVIRYLIIAAGASVAFQAACEIPALNALALIYACGLVALSEALSARMAFRAGLFAGFLVVAPQLAFFWKIFGPAAICLWAVISFFTGAFAATLQITRSRLGTKSLWLAAPVLWTGLEFFRSELYFLRFSWLSVGFLFSGHSGAMPVEFLGVYGCGFFVFLMAGIAMTLRGRERALMLGAMFLLLAVATNLPARGNTQKAKSRVLHVAGIQLEFPPDLQVPEYLDRVIQRYPLSKLIVLSEYSFDGLPPPRVRDWCRKNRRYLIAGGKRDAENPGEYYNTAFVLNPAGEIVFEQAKSVPIQFFKDGLPATEQRVWSSPWGKIAICVCYDMSYRRIMDRFMEQGAQALIVPFMDLTDWGKRQHELHSRVGPIRAREYCIPIFRVGSSGISQLLDRNGELLASAPFPGQEETIGGTLELGIPARLPIDTSLGPGCAILTSLLLVFPLLRVAEQKRRRKPG